MSSESAPSMSFPTEKYVVLPLFFLFLVERVFPACRPSSRSPSCRLARAGPVGWRGLRGWSESDEEEGDAEDSGENLRAVGNRVGTWDLARTPPRSSPPEEVDDDEAEEARPWESLRGIQVPVG